MPAEIYQVKLDIFEGPLDLLLYLVRREEVELYDLSLELLTRQYLDYLGQVAQPDLDVAGDFVAMAAHLIYLKSRRLLPPEHQPVAADDPGEDDDPRWELIRQLIEYKKFKDAAGHLQTIETARLDLFTRPPAPPPEPTSQDEALTGVLAMADISLLDLMNAFQRMLRRLEAQPEARTIFEENHTVAVQIERLRAVVEAAGGEPVLFSELFGPSVVVLEMVVTFLALLELVRLKYLRVTQSGAFAEVVVYRQESMGLVMETSLKVPTFIK